MNKKVLFAAANHWTSPYHVGSHELTKQFIKDGWDVAFISDPVSPLHYAERKNTLIQERFRIWKTGGEYYLNKKLWTYVPFSIFTPHNKPFLSSKFVFSNWHKFTSPNIFNKLQSEGFDKVDLIYIDSISQYFWLDYIKCKKSVLRVADKNSGFNKFSNSSKLFEQKLVSSVDLVVYSAKNLSSYVESYSPNKSLFLPNGVDFDHFYNGSRDLPKELSSIPAPRIIYVGAIDTWFDSNLIDLASKKLPGFSFILIGSPNKEANALQRNKNVHILGPKHYNELPRYLYNSDVAIIPFNVNEYPDLVNSINPLKLYQYLACGLPVIACRWDELEGINSPAYLYNSEKEFINTLESIVEKDIDKAKLVEFSRQNDWENKFSLLSDHLDLQNL